MIFKNFGVLENKRDSFFGSKRSSPFFFELLYCLIRAFSEHHFSVLNINSEIGHRLRNFYAFGCFEFRKIKRSESFLPLRFHEGNLFFERNECVANHENKRGVPFRKLSRGKFAESFLDGEGMLCKKLR